MTSHAGPQLSACITDPVPLALPPPHCDTSSGSNTETQPGYIRRENRAGADRGLQGRLESGSGGGNWMASQDLRSTVWLVVPGDQTHPCSALGPPAAVLWRQATSLFQACDTGKSFLPLGSENQETKHSYDTEPQDVDTIITTQPAIALNMLYCLSLCGTHESPFKRKGKSLTAI